MWPKPQETTDMVKFAGENRNGKLDSYLKKTEIIFT